MEDINQRLLMAVSFGEIDEIEKLLRDGADVTFQSKVYASPSIRVGHTPLMVAIESGRAAVVSYLIKSGANINQMNEFKSSTMTPLMLACYFQQVECVKALLESNVNVNALNHNGKSAIMFAPTGEDDESGFQIVKLLIESGADIQFKEHDSLESVIDIAKNFDKQDIVYLLQAYPGILMEQRVIQERVDLDHHLNDDCKTGLAF